MPASTNGHDDTVVREEHLFGPRKLRVVCIGAGFPGLTLAHERAHEWKARDYMDLVIYEKNSDIGGTWLENRYPGAACDVCLDLLQELRSQPTDSSFRLGTWSHLQLPV